MKAVFTALLFLALLVSKCAYDHNRRLEGRNNLLQQQNAQLQDTLRRHVRARDTLYIRDTTVKWRIVQRAETLLTTLRLSDTVTLTRRESVIVFAADSAIQACRSIVTSCEARIGVRDSLIRAITWERDHWNGSLSLPCSLALAPRANGSRLVT